MVCFSSLSRCVCKKTFISYAELVNHSSNCDDIKRFKLLVDADGELQFLKWNMIYDMKVNPTNDGTQFDCADIQCKQARCCEWIEHTVHYLDTVSSGYSRTGGIPRF